MPQLEFFTSIHDLRGSVTRVISTRGSEGGKCPYSRCFFVRLARFGVVVHRECIKRPKGSWGCCPNRVCPLVLDLGIATRVGGGTFSVPPFNILVKWCPCYFGAQGTCPTCPTPIIIPVAYTVLCVSFTLLPHALLDTSLCEKMRMRKH